MIKFIKVEILTSSTPFKPPLFLGSMLRGAFGMALKKVVCINPSYDCKGCFAADNCLFFDFYEKKNSFHPFRFDIRLGQENFDFSLYLFEDAVSKLPYILSSLYKMLNEQGIGVNREKIDIEKIKCNGKVVFDGKEFDLKGVEEKEFEIEDYSNKIKLIFHTPFRIKYQNKFLREKPELKLILNSIYNRYREIKGLERGKLPFEPKYEEGDFEIYFKDLTRYSNRQKTKMRLGGIVGEIEYKKIDKNSFELLKLGEIIGAGKQTVFGLGKIGVKPLEEYENNKEILTEGLAL